MTGAPAEAAILDALRRVIDPDRGEDIVTLRMVSGLAIKDGHVGFAIEVDPARGAALEPLRKAAEKAVDALPGVLSVSAVLTAERAAPGAQPPRRQAGAGPAGGPTGPGGKHRLPALHGIIPIP